MILIIHPSDPTIKRLKSIAFFLYRHLPDSKLFVVKPNPESKQNCLHWITKCNSNDLIIYLGHGCSHALLGAKGKLCDAFVDQEAIDEYNSDDYYDDEYLIDASNYNLFKNKKFICYGCKSADLSKKLLNNGILSVIGFGAVPTSEEEFYDFDKSIIPNNLLISRTKGAVTCFLKHGIVNALNGKATFGDLQRILKFEIQREIDKALSSKFRFRYELANTLYRIKKEIKVFGKIEEPLY